MLRSLVRILALTSILLCLAVLAASLGFTQPLVWPRAPRARLAADPARLRFDVEQLALGFGPRDFDHPSSLAASADFVAARLGESIGRVERQTWEARGVTLENIVGRLGPPGAPLVVVGAHYDTFGDAGPNPGADDNASGVAGLLELARLLAPLRLPVAVELVAFSGEEPPLFASPQMGSRVYAERLLERGQTPAVMVCLEMIGMFTPRQPWPSWLLRAIYPARGDFVLVLGRPEDRRWTAWLLSASRSLPSQPALPHRRRPSGDPRLRLHGPSRRRPGLRDQRPETLSLRPGSVTRRPHRRGRQGAAAAVGH